METLGVLNEIYKKSFPSLQRDEVLYAFNSHMESILSVIQEIENNPHCLGNDEIAKCIADLKLKLDSPGTNLEFFQELEKLIHSLIVLVDDIYEKRGMQIPDDYTEHLCDGYEGLLIVLRNSKTQAVADILG